MAGLAVLTLLGEAFKPVPDKRRLGYMLAAMVSVFLIYSFAPWIQVQDQTFFHGMYRFDAFALFFKRLFLLALAMVLVMAAEFSPRIETGVAEFYALLMLCATGMLLIASVNDFILLFVALELVTITFLRAGELSAATAAVAGGGHEVSDPRRAVERVHGVRHRLHLRDDRDDEFRQAQRADL